MNEKKQELLKLHGDAFARAVEAKHVLVLVKFPEELEYRLGFEAEEQANHEVWETVFRRGSSVRIEQAEAQLRRPGPKLRSVLAVPVRDLADQPIGILYAENRERFGAFEEQHLAAARGRAVLLIDALVDQAQTASEDGEFVTLKISKQDFWLRLCRQGLQAEQSGDLGAAEEQLRAALGLAKKFGSGDARTLRTQKDLARVLLLANKLKQASALVTDCLVHFQERQTVVHPDLASALAIQGAILESQGHPDKAEPLMLRALDVWEGLGSPDLADRAWLLDRLGGLYYRRGDYIRAGGRAREAATVARRMWGDRDRRTQLYRSHLEQVKAKL